jgi:hypothetical protein
MSAPFLPEGLWSLGAALLVGLLFGFFLERGGLGNPKKLVGLFYLKDFTMLQVMFTAIAVASSGLVGLSALGLIDLGAIAVPPTYLWPQMLGGVILGAGFVVGGY